MLTRLATSARPLLVAVVALFLIVGATFATNALSGSGRSVDTPSGMGLNSGPGSSGEPEADETAEPSETPEADETAEPAETPEATDENDDEPDATDDNGNDGPEATDDNANDGPEATDDHGDDSGHDGSDDASDDHGGDSGSDGGDDSGPGGGGDDAAGA